MGVTNNLLSGNKVSYPTISHMNGWFTRKKIAYICKVKCAALLFGALEVGNQTGTHPELRDIKSGPTSLSKGTRIFQPSFVSVVCNSLRSHIVLLDIYAGYSHQYIPYWEATYIPSKANFHDDFPFRKVGYVIVLWSVYTAISRIYCLSTGKLLWESKGSQSVLPHEISLPEQALEHSPKFGTMKQSVFFSAEFLLVN